MRISLNWLSDYIDISNIPADQIADNLTSLGLEVESIETVSSISGPVVVGEIVDAQQHPDADQLRVCKVNVGEPEPLEIVCGAPNAKIGVLACVAKVGSTLPGNFKIKKSKIRGVASYGMMCAEDELGISSMHDEIIELDSSTAIGTSVAKLYELEDTVLTLGLTPNRSDCLGYIGVARDLAAKLGIPLKTPDQSDIKLSQKLTTSSKIRVDVANSEDCPRFCALYVDNVSTACSPLKIRNRLEAAGMRSVNLIVDITNYVMLEYGQPIHAYDVKDIAGQKISVRTANNNEKITTLDGEIRTLETTDILICDNSQAIGIAGVMGGENSEVKDDTSAIVIEVASFNPRSIRKTAKRIGLHTEASHRFERGIDIEAAPEIAYRVASLIQAHTPDSPPEIANEMIDIYPSPRREKNIAIRTPRARQILGTATLTGPKIQDSLEALGIMLVDKTENDKRLLFRVPSWRNDIDREIDLIEEVGRIIGYDNIPYSMPLMEIGALPENPFIEFIDRSRIALAQCGFSETISFPFVSVKDFNYLRLPDGHFLKNTVKLTNPLSEESNFLQPTLLVNLLKALKHNHSHGTKACRIFEIGRAYLHTDESNTSGDAFSQLYRQQGLHFKNIPDQETRPIERNLICAIIDQPLKTKSWQSEKDVCADFFDIKSMFLQWLKNFTTGQPNFTPIDPNSTPYLHPNAAANITLNNQIIGTIGEIHPATALDYDLDPAHPPVVFEVHLDALFSSKPSEEKIESDLQKFPSVSRDFAYLVPEEISFEKFSEVIKSFPRKKFLNSFHLFDIYQGENISEGRKSMGFSFSFQSPKKTLSDKDVEKEINALQQWLSDQIQAEIR